MEKPRCRLCGARHLGGEPHVFTDTPRGKRKPDSASPRELGGEVVEVSRVLFDELTEDAEKWRRLRERRREYMREYRGKR